MGSHFVDESTVARELELVTVGRAHSLNSSAARHYQLDCGELDSLRQIVRDEIPTHIVNFSGHTGDEFDLQIRYNVEVSEALLSAGRELNHPPRVILLGSAAEYGIPGIGPLDENSPLRPTTLYGLTKKMQSELAAYHGRTGSDRVNVVIARVFNALGVGLSEKLVFGSFVRQIIEMGHEGVLRVGNIDTARDFIHIADVVRAIDALLTFDTPDPEYVVASGRTWTIRSLLECLVDASGKQIAIEVDKTRVRQNDVASIFGSYANLQRSTGWRPERTPEEALREMLAAEKEQ